MATAKLTYFKASGKYAYSGEMEMADTTPPHTVPDMIQQLNFFEKLPGLSSGTWGGFVHVDMNDHPLAFPMLVRVEYPNDRD